MVFDLVIFLITLFIMLIGLVGIVLPNLPGIVLIWTGVFFYGVMTKFAEVDDQFLIFITSLAFLAILLDYAENLWGSKRTRTSVRVIIGAILGGLIASLADSFPILLVGTFAGAIIGQMLSGRDPIFTVETGGYKIILFMGGTLIQVAVGVTIIELFLLRILPL